MVTFFFKCDGNPICQRLDTGALSFPALPQELALQWPQVARIVTATPQGDLIRQVDIDKSGEPKEDVCEERTFLHTVRRKTKKKKNRTPKVPNHIECSVPVTACLGTKTSDEEPVKGPEPEVEEITVETKLNASAFPTQCYLIVNS